ncbi:hypothetical protein [Metallibacterium scheffleri]|uniref:Uncharacterized protein n=1 Tax=Metallibacterium scheffleri TaxID=993689 RepID=A0A4S3KKU8_9GAMM|nr:hypothetical protein [Metallibacterium scheffleri]THD09300.1 hypothetical protein B1806_11250 [Metallibacterium scheffleri]
MDVWTAKPNRVTRDGVGGYDPAAGDLDRLDAEAAQRRDVAARVGRGVVAGIRTAGDDGERLAWDVAHGAMLREDRRGGGGYSLSFHVVVLVLRATAHREYVSIRLIDQAPKGRHAARGGPDD